jgi:hypothetical protein
MSGAPPLKRLIIPPVETLAEFEKRLELEWAAQAPRPATLLGIRAVRHQLFVSKFSMSVTKMETSRRANGCSVPCSAGEFSQA